MVFHRYIVCMIFFLMQDAQSRREIEIPPLAWERSPLVKSSVFYRSWRTRCVRMTPNHRGSRRKVHPAP
ncbi:hypothetical protein KC19_VG339000 [Ceratodon purpureus]|uniref:Secreted protein n=1 Tax=Ceratodon purpureus TaxID=3225 RepID=A0A8T0HY21_CERPU|nr:hypothetical protein KC19_VG339000 [Ceratodon purpureus]